MNVYVIRFLHEEPVVIKAATLELAVMRAWNVKEEELWSIMEGVKSTVLTKEQAKELGLYTNS
jgi:hypothetical protein